MDVGKFKIRLKALPIQYREEHKEFLATIMKDFDESSTLDKIWGKLQDYWSFLNYSLLENLIHHLKYDDLKQEMSKYLVSLEHFQSNTRVCDFARYWNNICTMKKLEADLKEFVFRCKCDWKVCTLQEVINLQGYVMRKFHLNSFTAYLQKVEAGSLIITWLLPKEITTHIESYLQNTESLKSFCAEYGISFITFDGKGYHCLSSSDESGLLYGSSCNMRLY